MFVILTFDLHKFNSALCYFDSSRSILKVFRRLRQFA